LEGNSCQVAQANGHICLIAAGTPGGQRLFQVRLRSTIISLLERDDAEAGQTAGQHPRLIILTQEWDCLGVHLLCRGVAPLAPAQAAEKSLHHGTHRWRLFCIQDC
jgi:hypothetical protein